ncbi:TPA: hypothetical protein I7114_22565 [Vibrio vulnificus]|uniref:hypothetical protein n=1 Tax=Vibrio TaxID=662 RepID=UPI001023653F|nr:hypothetical protein [Vibrio vulnificus]HCG9161515.1 hypothetical protein [Vibrio parahaemolyticus]EIO3980400.1 hypothetical protein [Vibrio vulnificus]RZP67154.1 hypothetical protein D8T45_07635 [Vibrio vulnificus]RZR08405.1 hypothetical protein D8T24_21545 [Vibrio vulnificus]HAS6069462.1 hypothetical protein [Vibrio vulnificus]
MSLALALRIPKGNGKRSFEATICEKEAIGFALSHKQREIAVKGLKLVLLDQVDQKTAVAILSHIEEQEEKGRFDIYFTDVERKHYIDIRFPKGYDAHKGCTVIEWDDYFLFG